MSKLTENNTIYVTDTAIAIAGSVDSGKCFGKGTPIMMYDCSIKKVEDIRLGDVIMGDDSTPRIVFETHSGTGQLYKITPEKGDSYIVNGEHILCLKWSGRSRMYYDSSRKRYCVQYTMVEKNIPTIKMKSFPIKNKTKLIVKKMANQFMLKTRGEEIQGDDIIEISVNTYIKLKSGIKKQLKWFRNGLDLKEQNLPFDPYILGLWLGDGTSANTDITNIDEEIINHCRIYGNNMGMDFVPHGKIRHSFKQKGNSRKSNGNMMLNFLRAYRLLNNKHIPDIYKFNSRENRLKLLAGLIDTDGYYDKEKNYYDFCFSANNETLVDDIIFLIRSLGFPTYKQATIKVCTNSSRGRIECKCFRFGFGGFGQEDIPCLVERKKPRERITKKRNMISGIKITSDISGTYYGFGLDGNKRFLLGDFSVAHNSTFVGVMTTGILDDGDGSARSLVAKHKHEIESHKTSDVTTRMVKLENGRAMTFIDLCGHDKYFKSTAFGISGCYPDYAIIIVGSNRGVLPMTKQHYRLIASYNIPTLIIMTRTDITPIDQYTANRKTIGDLCKKYKQTAEIKNDYFDDKYTSNIEKEKIVLSVLENIKLVGGKQTSVPVLTISNKTGYYVDVIKKIISLLSPRQLWGELEDNNNRIVKFFKTKLGDNAFAVKTPLDGSIFYVDGTYKKQGIRGIIVSGICRGAPIKTGDSLFIGPFGKEFKHIEIKSIHNNVKQTVPYLDHHHRGCMAIVTDEKEQLKRNDIKKGMIIVSTPTLTRRICYRFTAAVSIMTDLQASITIRNGYAPVIHMGTIRQTARLMIDPDKNEGRSELCFGDTVKRLSNIKSGDVAVVSFKFRSSPESIEPYSVFVLRSGEIQGIGVVLSILPVDEDTDAKADPIKVKRFRRFRAKTDKEHVAKA